MYNCIALMSGALHLVLCGFDEWSFVFYSKRRLCVPTYGFDAWSLVPKEEFICTYLGFDAWSFVSSSKSLSYYCMALKH